MHLSEHVTLEEFERNSHGVPNTPPADVVPVLKEFCEKILEPLRAWVGGPVVITSGYRSPELNKAVNGVADSYHQARPDRCAADVQTPSRPLHQTFDWLCKESGLMFDSVILERRKSGSSEAHDCIHIQFRRFYPRRIAFMGSTHNRSVYTPVVVA